MRITLTEPGLTDAFVAYLCAIPGWVASAGPGGQIEITVPDARTAAAEQRRVSAQFRAWRRTLPPGRRIDFGPTPD